MFINYNNKNFKVCFLFICAKHMFQYLRHYDNNLSQLHNH